MPDTPFDLAAVRVCFIAGTLGQGGAERQLFYMLKTLRQAGASPQLLCLTQGEHWEAQIRALGIPVTWVGQATGRFARLQAIIQTCRQLNPQIIQSQHFYTNLYAAAAARRLGLRDIGALRNNGHNEVLATGRIMGWLSLHVPRMIAANSKGGAAYARQQGLSAERVFFLPNVIDSEAFAAPPRQPGATLQLLTIGRLEPQKRVDRLLTLLAQLRQRITPAFRLVIAGDGSLRATLEQQARNLGLLPDFVEFRGAVKETVSLYREADIFLLASDFEGTPNVVMEAMAAGLPIVCTNVGGIPEIIQHGISGLMFEPSDEAGFLDGLLSLTYHPPRQIELGNAARHYIETNHSLQRLPEILSELYQRALR